MDSVIIFVDSRYLIMAASLCAFLLEEQKEASTSVVSILVSIFLSFGEKMAQIGRDKFI